MNCPDQDCLPLVSLLQQDGVVLADWGFGCKAGTPDNLFSLNPSLILSNFPPHYISDGAAEKAYANIRANPYRQ
jgi:hypothetical protein